MKKVAIILLLSTFIFACKNQEQKSLDESKDDIALNSSHEFMPMVTANLSSGRLMRLDSISSEYITSRPVDVWLPEGYSENKIYSVLYMHDGQMLFDSTTTWNKQEWKVDEWAGQLMAENTTDDFIVVAIHNIPQIRWQDLFPQKAFKLLDESVQEQLLKEAINASVDSKFNGDNYLKFIVEELKPIIDKEYAVYADRSHTFIMGSSMGGLMSMYAISEYPNIFGGAACISTHWVGAMPRANNPFPEAIFSYMESSFPKAGNHKVYFDYGDKTLDQHYPQYAPEVDRILDLKGYSNKDSKNLFFEGTDHSENSWNRRLDRPLTFLLGKGVD